MSAVRLLLLIHRVTLPLLKVAVLEFQSKPSAQISCLLLDLSQEHQAPSLLPAISPVVTVAHQSPLTDSLTMTPVISMLSQAQFPSRKRTTLTISLADRPLSLVSLTAALIHSLARLSTLCAQVLLPLLSTFRLVLFHALSLMSLPRTCKTDQEFSSQVTCQLAMVAVILLATLLQFVSILSTSTTNRSLSTETSPASALR